MLDAGRGERAVESNTCRRSIHVDQRASATIVWLETEKNLGIGKTLLKNGGLAAQQQVLGLQH